MRINDQNKVLDRQYQSEIKAKEERIKEINDAYNKKIQEIKEASDNEIREKRNFERERISQELGSENEKWEEVRKKHREKNELIEAQDLKEELNREDEIKTNRLRHGEILEKEDEILNKDITSMRERGNKTLRDMREDTNAKIYQEEIKSRENINSLREGNKRLENITIKSYGNFSREQQREIDRAIAEKDREHREIIRHVKEENSRQLNERERISQENLKRMEESNKNKLTQAEKGYKGKIEQMQKESDQTIENMALKAQKEINKIKQSESKDKSLIKDRSNDPFYSITNLNPKLTDNEKEYYLRLSVPEHEKESVIVGGDAKTIKISQTRRFSDESKNEDGTVNKSARSEVASQVIKLDEVINPRKITQFYENNELIFKIPKA